jgi:hypothetical protein
MLCDAITSVISSSGSVQQPIRPGYWWGTLYSSYTLVLIRGLAVRIHSLLDCKKRVCKGIVVECSRIYV